MFIKILCGLSIIVGFLEASEIGNYVFHYDIKKNDNSFVQNRLVGTLEKEIFFIHHKSDDFLYIKCTDTNNKKIKEVGSKMLHNRNSYDIKCLMNKDKKAASCKLFVYDVMSFNDEVNKAIDEEKCVNIESKQVINEFNFDITLDSKDKINHIALDSIFTIEYRFYFIPL